MNRVSANFKLDRDFLFGMSENQQIENPAFRG